MEEEIRKVNLKHKVKPRGSMTAAFSTMPSGKDLALVDAVVDSEYKNLSKKEEITDEVIENAVVLSGEVTTIDFMMPDAEREIIEKNLNTYSNVKETQKILNIARTNKKLSEDIKSLEIIDTLGEASKNMLESMNHQLSVDSLNEYFQKKIDDGADIAKAYKEVATAAKIMLDARAELVKQLTPQGNKKNARIALKFTNDNGEDFQLGVDLGG